ncbi:hypothetical protein Tco_1069387 [Tanacetum coccineum]|uniref:Uncharacterized protein n=1 Tax=Tanacetum coccineum TaxID=301880 RepID=A0ABQ5HIT8_9ASTR
MPSSLLQWVLTMIPKSKDWVERLCPNSKLPNFNTGRILGLENQAVNESHELKGISPHSPREISGLGITKQTNPESQTSSSKTESGSVTVQSTELSTFSVSIEAEQNGMAKRKNITLIEATKIMLNGSVLLKHFWTEAVPLSSYSNTYPQDRWSRDQHIEVVNIIGDPSEGMFTKSMVAKLTAASASECLFADFLSKTEPKKVSEALKHPGCVDAMQEKLNQFYKNKVWTLVLPLKENLSLVPNRYSGTRRMNIELSSGIKQGLLLKGIVKKKESIMLKHFLMLQDDEVSFYTLFELEMASPIQRDAVTTKTKMASLDLTRALEYTTQPII